MNKIYYDDALACFVSIANNVFGKDVLERNVFLRDAQGKLTFVYQNEVLQTNKVNKFIKESSNKLSQYLDDDYIIATPDDLFDDSLKQKEKWRQIKVSYSGVSFNINLIERRIVGSDWLTSVNNINSKPAKIVFSSIKGGVGRTTAICIIAAHFSREGKRVLTIDMDLEAPGLGSMLIKPDVMPKFGLLDYFVESSLDNTDDKFMVDLVGSSWVSDGKGRVDVIPALGSLSLQNPENVLGKISRAYLSESDVINQSLLMTNLQKLMDYYSQINRYDIILIDARSGLHETTASLLVGLGANIFFFGVNQPQTILGFELLFSHLKVYNSANEEWANKLRFIHAKASAEQDLVFPELIETNIKKYFYNLPKVETSIDLDSLKDTFELDWSNESEDVIHLTEELDENEHIITINYDARYHDFDPLENPGILTSDFYQEAFSSLIKEVDGILNGYTLTEVDFD
ncbi:tyrosine-protein kinase family protein [Klebsiella quasipneumoniae]|uniref:tyrosine-protein kinase family protein n=3 Tax=Klebsiella quasipneumoniae TaxID=1463165 RepID=UPI000B422FD3|nr:AAA family ATPase [Klebsiella quasipneumoniae]NWM01800.1 ParA family protein [Klebsiella quasipneumoniae]RNT44491.1 ParA family protein [Klebsiella quasipneumoniae subsp. quasipneumoniae]TBP42881.1 ParA family protein [Klebsiella quasipneumoniae subsp. quasipneumoniae]TBP68689.1 ParA family protein [Klebsiella quasipneumoniae subsp. quasipneumoniae]TBQ03227.1 ParA family protein [Klebsiella quasipneumoniae subsp. quasipneumoniae]